MVKHDVFLHICPDSVHEHSGPSVRLAHLEVEVRRCMGRADMVIQYLVFGVATGEQTSDPCLSTTPDGRDIFYAGSNNSAQGFGLAWPVVASDRHAEH